MASFWQYITVELKNMWAEGQPIPQMPLDADPDLDCCLLHQQLQVINCSIARKRRRSIAKESLDSLIIKGASPDREGSLNSSEKTSPSYNVFAKTKSGDYVLRLGAVQPSENLIMLETGEPVFSPVTQEGPVFTEELIKETEALVLQTGSVGPGCSQLLSDMQSFKAANPGCILEDFVRWYSPPDWSEVESDDEPTVVDEEGSSRRGRLSIRMQKEGNLWLQLWEAAKALPAVNQAPIFDEDVEVESILTTLGSIQPSDLFEQLFVSLLSAGFIIAEASVPRDDNLAKLFAECKHFVTAAYQSGQSNEKLKDICQVYETVEVIIHHPEEVIKPTEQPQPDDTAATESKAEPNTEPKIESKTDPKSRFKKLNLMRKEMQPPWKRSSRDDNKSEEKSSNIFSQIFDKKTSLFPKKSPKTTAPTPAPTTSNLDDNEWMIV